MAIEKVAAGDPETVGNDAVAANLAALKALFPQAFNETGVDWECLRDLIGAGPDEVPEDERYGLNWPGKRRAARLALTPSAGTLLPARDDSVDWDSTRNLMIEGDNLEVLKLLRKSYAGKVKLIYIDPPYNTGKDFVYPDDYKDNLGNYLRRTGQRDAEGVRNSSNAESSGRFHTDWLNMMYPRLMLARDLLAKNGAIFASCDEAEHANLRAAMSGIFGEENFVGDMVWAAGRKNDSQLISVSHEYIVCYVRDIGYLKEAKTTWRQRKKGLEPIYTKVAALMAEHGHDYGKATEALKNWYKNLADGEPSKAHKHYSVIDRRGVYFPADISWPGGGGPKFEVFHPNGKPVAIPGRGWMTSDPAKMDEWIADDRVHFGPDESYVPCIKAYLKDREYQTPYSVFYQDGRAATKRLRDMMGEQVFDFPKDETVLREIVEMATRADDIVVDFFAGSGTTGHAVMAQNAIDGGNRRYILVQLPEPLDSANKEQKTAADFCDKLGRPRTIAELTKERLRRAAAKVRADHPGTTADLGFRVYKLAESNIRAWAPGEDIAADLATAADNLRPGRTDDDLLVELLLKQGIDLTEPAVTKTLAGADVHAFGGGVLIVCLADIKAANAATLADAIADWHAELKPAAQTTIFFRDSGFENDVAKTNIAATLEQRLGDALLKVRSL